MNDNITTLRVKQQLRNQDTPPQGMTKLFTGIPIHEWMFGNPAHQHLVSRDNPASLTYVCQVCGLIEPKRKPNGWLRRRCACEIALYEQESHAAFKAQNQAFMDAQKSGKTYTWLGDDESGLEVKTFDNFNAKYQAKAFAECQSWVGRFLQARQFNDTFSLNIVLMGSYGTGKTHLGAAILNALRAQCIPCLFATVQGFFNALYSKSFEEKLHLNEQASVTPLLVLDELDKLYIKQASEFEVPGKYQKAMLAELLDKRYKRRLPTIITTNEQKDLGMWLDGATISRLQERITALSMNGVDYRSRGSK